MVAMFVNDKSIAKRQEYKSNTTILLTSTLKKPLKQERSTSDKLQNDNCRPYLYFSSFICRQVRLFADTSPFMTKNLAFEASMFASRLEKSVIHIRRFFTHP